MLIRNVADFTIHARVSHVRDRYFVYYMLLLIPKVLILSNFIHEFPK